MVYYFFVVFLGADPNLRIPEVNTTIMVVMLW